MLVSMKDRKAVCLASSQGLGFAIARELYLAGGQVLLVSRDAGKLAASAAALEEEGRAEGAASAAREDLVTPSTFAVDLREKGAAGQVAKAAEKELGGIDALVNNIGGPPPGLFEALDDSAWEDGYNQLVGAYARQFRAALPLLRKSSSPRVLTVTSVSARQPIPGLLLSNTFRAGLVGMTKTLAQEYAAEGILLNNLAPGMFDTDRLLELDRATAQRQNKELEVVRRERKAQIPLGRYGDPRELGRAALFLLSPMNTYITGQTILVDGGLYKGL